MFWRKRNEVVVDSGWEIPNSLLELLEILDAEYLILAPGEQVLSRHSFPLNDSRWSTNFYTAT
jgi:hypothetical protein